MIIQASIPLWNRDHEDGSYSAEPEGWKLVVTYTPEPPPPGGPFGFSWKATPAEGTSGKEMSSTELLEEPEQAMMQAEQAIGLRDKDGVPVKRKDEPIGQRGLSSDLH